MRAEGFSSSIESQANKFAADILMPDHLIDKARLNGLTSVSDLAKNFEVSKDAMSIRLYKTAYSNLLFED